MCITAEVACVYQVDRILVAEEENKRRESFIDSLRTLPEDEAVDVLRRFRAINGTERDLSLEHGNGPHYPDADFVPLVESQLPFELQDDLSSNGNSIHNARLDAGFLPPNGTMTPVIDSPVIDSGLELLDISYWTDVSISNDTVARVMSAYLESRHPMWELLDANLLIRDLVQRRLQFCSSFLVNALLSYACQQRHRVVNTGEEPLATAFLHVTELLWRVEQSADSLINVAATMMFSLASEIGTPETQHVTALDLLNSGCLMAERLGLFGIRPHQDLSSAFEATTVAWRSASAQIEWRGPHPYTVPRTQ